MDIDSDSANTKTEEVFLHIDINKDGSLISWKFRKQTTITFFTCEAQYMVLCSPMQEVNFLKQYYQDMKGDQVEINIYADNQIIIRL